MILYTRCSFTRIGFDHFLDDEDLYDLSKGVAFIDVLSLTSLNIIPKLMTSRNFIEGEMIIIFLYDEPSNTEVIQGVHFVYKGISQIELKNYLFRCKVTKHTWPALSDQVSRLVYLKSLGLSNELISYLSGRSVSAAKNSLSYAKRKLNIKKKQVSASFL